MVSCPSAKANLDPDWESPIMIAEPVICPDDFKCRVPADDEMASEPITNPPMIPEPVAVRVDANKFPLKSASDAVI